MHFSNIGNVGSHETVNNNDSIQTLKGFLVTALVFELSGKAGATIQESNFNGLTLALCVVCFDVNICISFKTTSSNSVVSCEMLIYVVYTVNDEFAYKVKPV